MKYAHFAFAALFFSLPSLAGEYTLSPGQHRIFDLIENSTVEFECLAGQADPKRTPVPSDLDEAKRYILKQGETRSIGIKKDVETVVICSSSDQAPSDQQESGAVVCSAMCADTPTDRCLPRIDYHFVEETAATTAAAWEKLKKSCYDNPYRLISGFGGTQAKNSPPCVTLTFSSPGTACH